LLARRRWNFDSVATSSLIVQCISVNDLTRIGLDYATECNFQNSPSPHPKGIVMYVYVLGVYRAALAVIGYSHVTANKNAPDNLTDIPAKRKSLCGEKSREN
jgi:hypothetical protein